MRYSRHSRHFTFSKRWALIIGTLLVAFLVGVASHAKANALEPVNTVNIYTFWGEGCPHCAHAKEVLDPYIEQKDNIKQHKYEVYFNTENQRKLQAVGEGLGVNVSGIPLIIVGDKSFAGFTDATGEQIKDRLEYCSTNSCPDNVARILGVEPGTANAVTTQPTASDTSDKDKLINIPFIGNINVADFSLPALTVIIGLLDGFNPCAMWALLFIITLLIGMHDRRKMWLYGTTFIVTSAAVYFVFMAAWLNLFMFIGYVTWVRILIGLLAIGIGGYYLYDWYQNRAGCKVTGGKRRQAAFAKLRKIVKEKNILIGLGGIVVLAAMVNVVELACSAGLPVLYTGILSSAGLETWQYYAYMLLYILFFMLDDLIVFSIAMTTFKIAGVGGSYTRVIRLVGGLLMLTLGALLIFAPHVLMFG